MLLRHLTSHHDLALDFSVTVRPALRSSSDVIHSFLVQLNCPCRHYLIPSLANLPLPRSYALKMPSLLAPGYASSLPRNHAGAYICQHAMERGLALGVGDGTKTNSIQSVMEWIVSTGMESCAASPKLHSTCSYDSIVARASSVNLMNQILLPWPCLVSQGYEPSRMMIKYDRLCYARQTAGLQLNIQYHQCRLCGHPLKRRL
ncbi:hypothetical protein BKA80DRAFT_143237 [Phyllosticta citrichinensis]